ncbi:MULTISPECIES: hypothetical protein [unclassified Vibrio]|uniref:hypothetical protein n=1 Tax=unclassified Vibrio TaxID=2614977 RepID=UPI00148281F3|nr:MULTISPECIES: hypothetical protein [unclassified Vibrio]MDQ2194487.1 hypothetical protein [Vibrio sp. A14(2019)]MDQ2196728.1 hypothetical protein [Vibrio sp. 2017_1457_11]NNN75945.1 hypothetical protein [Vibrio sp. B7]NNN92512.1 hypothetical protein [Vibrio sp. B8-1]NNO08035.1 hypothetical protein [Vibrio sp. B4-12]
MIFDQHSKTNQFDLNASTNQYRNSFGDPLWCLEDEDGKIKVVDFLEWKCSDDKIVWAQSFILKRADGYVNAQQKIVISDLGTWNPIINKLRGFCEYWESNNPTIPLSRWTQKDIIKFIKEVMTYRDEDGNQCVKHHGQEEGYRHILYRSYQYFTSSAIIDGLRVVVTRQFTGAILEPYLKQSGTTLATWLKGGTFGTIPIENGMVVLAHALNLLKSKRANAARAFYNFMRENQPTNPTTILSLRENLFPENRNCPRSGTSRGPRKKNIRKLKDLLEEKLDGESPDLFTEGNLGDFVVQLYNAASYILLVLSGFRLSEWVTFKANDFQKLPDGTWEFCNEIHKTNHSIKSPRYLHSMAVLAVDTLIECSYVDKVSENAPVFIRTFRTHSFVSKNKRMPKLSEILDKKIWGEHPDITIRSGFDKFYSETIKQHPELAKIHNTTTPHQARHLWAEYTIRRFDGAVIDLITEHFRHRYSDNFIRSYYEDALRERERDDIELAYIEDILRRIGSRDESLSGFYGPAAKRARNELRKALLISTDDFDFVLASLTESIIITVDEWGYCLLRKDEESLAKCWNKDLGMIMVEESRSFEICGSCPHSCNTKLQRNGIERSLIAHEEFIKALPAELSRLADSSRKHIRTGEIRLKAMDDE